MFQHQNTSRSTHATSRMSDSPLAVQLEEPTASPNMKQASPEELSPPNTSLHTLSSGRTEPAGMVPTRCLSPDRQEHKFGLRGSEDVNRLLNLKSSVSLCRRFLQEVKLDDSQQHKVELLKFLVTQLIGVILKYLLLICLCRLDTSHNYLYCQM